MVRSVVAVFAAAAAPASAQTPWADHVVSYTPGTGVGAGYNVAQRALGEPTRFTGIGTPFPAAVTPFSPAWEGTDIVSIGTGGSLVVRFDEAIHDNPLNPYGIDLLIFGNTGFIDTSFPNGVAGGLFGNGGGTVEVSNDGLNWQSVIGVGDGVYPSMGYSDLTDPYSSSPGAILSDFTRPVDPAFNWMGRNFAEIVAAYNGSGGGAGIDLSGSGLSSISYVRMSNLAPDVTIEIDALSTVSVPAPGAALVLATLLGAAARRRRA
jgi:MYXO-CTERM domain-containing protein